jgi:endonuclease/exonuclease/phosphatase family metal-dependent hydrolase
VLVLSWNLYGGRLASRSRFAEVLDSSDWDVALLQEVPAWWELSPWTVRASRTQFMPFRRSFLSATPAQSTAILSRLPVVAHAFCRLRVFPERRFVHAVLLGQGVWVGNLHAHQFSLGGKLRDHARAVAALRRWAGSAPIVLGGDWNVYSLSLPGFSVVASHELDHIAVRGGSGDGGVLPAPQLSDHAPICANVHLTPL